MVSSTATELDFDTVLKLVAAHARTRVGRFFVTDAPTLPDKHQALEHAVMTRELAGLLDDGEMAPDGNYSVSITAENAGGDEFPVTTLMTGPVDGLRYDNNQAIVMVGEFEYYVSEIYKVS